MKRNERQQELWGMGEKGGRGYTLTSSRKQIETTQKRH